MVVFPSPVEAVKSARKKLAATFLSIEVNQTMGFGHLHRRRPRQQAVVALAVATSASIRSPPSVAAASQRFVTSNKWRAAFELPPTKHLPPRSDDGSTIAYIHHEPPSPRVKHSPSQLGQVFFPGFLSNMHSSKACRIFRYAETNNLECPLFDRYGHGASRPHYSSDEYDGRQATIGRWLEDCLAILDDVTSASNEQILIGSSMGTWLAILAAMQRPERVAGILGIASAPDYTALLREQIEANLEWSNQLDNLGYVDVPTVYDRRGYYRLHEELIVEGDKHLILQEDNQDKDFLSRLPRNMPIRLLHGTADEDIPAEYSQRLMKKLEARNFDNVKLDLIEGGDHRLSSQEHLEKIENVLCDIVHEAGGDS